MLTKAYAVNEFAANESATEWCANDAGGRGCLAPRLPLAIDTNKGKDESGLFHFNALPTNKS